jgi:hypothetical protein
LDKIQGPNYQSYDPQYLQVSRRLAPESVKPNVFREIDDEVAKALLMQDVVNLSPEAREILRKLRSKLEKTRGKAFVEGKEEDFKELLAGLKQLKETLYEEDEDREDEEKQRKKRKAEEAAKTQKMIIPLSSGPQRTAETPGPARSQPAFHGNGRVRELIEKMVVDDASSSQRTQVARELDALGEKMVSYVKSFGAHIIVLERGRNLTQKKIKGMLIVAPGERTFDGRRWEDVRGIYCQDRRIIVIGEELLGISNHSAIRHEFAHAFDHAFTQRNQRRLPLSVQLWNWFEKDRKALPSRYAATNPAEYFAESVDAYFITDGRAYLEQNDPQMFEYLSTLFNSA